MTQEDDQRKSIVQQILQKSTDFLRRIIAPVGGQGGVTLSCACSHCHRFPIEDDIWWVSTRHGKKQCRGGDSFVETLFEGLQEQSKLNIMDALRRFIEVDNHEAERIRDLEKNSEAIKVVGPTSTEKMFPDAAVREVVDDLTRRRGEEGMPHLFINKFHVRCSWLTPLVDEDCHTVCQAICKGIEGEALENLCCTSVEKSRAVIIRQPSTSRKDQTS